VKELFASCVYAIKLPQTLLEASRTGTELIEGKRWVGAEKMLSEATDAGQELAIVFADSRDCSLLIGWSVIRKIVVHEKHTEYWIGPMWRLPRKRPQDLVRWEKGRRIAPDYIRSYVLCETPLFLRREAESRHSWPYTAAVEDEVREGRVFLRTHEGRERAPALVRQLKEDHKARNDGHLPCQVCGFDFLGVYGDVGAGFAEAHHIVPLAQAPTRGRPASTKDFIVVCANCHRMLHQSPEFPSIEALRKFVHKNTKE
jgi:hypothetical protein